MRTTFLTEEQSRFLRTEKESLMGISSALAGIDVAPSLLLPLQQAILQLEELFLIVVVGEFNAGKSALVNALLGEKVLREGATPTTARVTLVKWGEQEEEKVIDENFAIVTYPLPLLKELNIVDTPGTNAVIRHHERLTEEFVPRSDLVLFTTSAERPMTESERQFLERILAWGKKVIFALNKSDIFEEDASLREVRDFVLKHATIVLGDAPEFFPVSARLAQRAFSESDPEKKRSLRLASRLDDLEKYIQSTLDDSARLRLKFNNPLGVAEHLLAQTESEIRSQEEDLKVEKETALFLKTILTDYERDLRDELPPRLAEVENTLRRLEQLGLDFFDRTFRLTNIKDLMHGDVVRAEFEKEVQSDIPQQIEQQVQRLIDWLVQKDLNEWLRVMTYLQQRRARTLETIVGEGGDPREARRRELVEKMGRSAQSIVETYDQQKEASALAANVEAAVAQTALLEVGAVGLGTILTVAVLSSTLDITGILAAGTMAILGFFVIPLKRKQTKDNFQQRMTALRTKLVGALTSQFTLESNASLERLRNGISPFIRYVDAEGERIQKASQVIEEARRRLSSLRAQIPVVVK